MIKRTEHSIESQRQLETDITLESLRLKAARLEELERRIATLEAEKMAISRSTAQLNKELARVKREKEDWDWFFDHSMDILCIASLDGYLKRVNKAFTDTLGFSPEDLLKSPFIDFVHPDDVENTLIALKALGEGSDCINFENRYRDVSGEWHWLSWRCPALTYEANKLFAIATDITESKQTQAEILYRARHDYLTGLLNRAAFEHELNAAILRTERHDSSQIALILIDLDGFKRVNDDYGHAVGDQVLRQTANRFKSIQRKNDVVCRIGGDEFVWVIEGIEPLDVSALSERIVTTIGQPFNVENDKVSIGCSIGISTYPKPAPDAKALYTQADSAMYSVKRSGAKGFSQFQDR